MKDKIELHIDNIQVTVNDNGYGKEHISKMSALSNGNSAFENYRIAKNKHTK